MRTRLRPLLANATWLLVLGGLAIWGVVDTAGSSKPAAASQALALGPGATSVERSLGSRQLVSTAWTAPSEADQAADEVLSGPSPILAEQAATLDELPARVLYGYVLDELGQPISGARLTPWRQAGAVETLELRRAVTSSGSGAFELDGEPRGSTRVRVEHASFYTQTVALGWLGETRVVLQARERLQGRVVTRTGAPASDQRVTVRPKDSLATRQEVLTDGQGRFELWPEAAGPLHLDVRGPRGDLIDVAVDPTAPGELLLVLGATHRVRARVLDAEGAPLSGARVVLLSPGTRRALDSETSDAAGLATFEHAPDEPLQLLAEFPTQRFEPVAVARSTQTTELRGTFGASVRLVASPAGARELKLHPGPGVPDISRTLVQHTGEDLVCAKLAPGDWQLEVSALSSSAGPLIRVALLEQRDLVLTAGTEERIELDAPPAGSLLGSIQAHPGFPVEAQLESALDGRLVESLTLDETGAFHFETLAPGPYQLAFLAAGGGEFRDPRRFDVRPAEPTRVAIALPTHGVDLLVRDTFGQPIPHAEVSSGATGRSGSILSTDSLGSQRLSAASPRARADDDGLVFLPWTSPAISGSPITSVLVTATDFEPQRVEVHSTHLEVLLQRTAP